MIWLELKRIITRAPVLFTVCFVVPLLILACLVPGITKPTASPADLPAAIKAAEDRLDGTHGIIDGLATVLPANASFTHQLHEKWITFGGMSASGSTQGDVHGAYYNFYWAEGYENNAAELFDAFTIAKTKFIEFYTLYSEYIAGTPKVFIKQNDWRKFTNGVEDLHRHFGKNYSDAASLREARKQCNIIRTKVPFRKIIESTRQMILYPAQADELRSKLGEFTEKRDKLPRDTIDDDLRYLNFNEMSYEYMIYHINKYAKANADFNTAAFYNQVSPRQVIRIEYLLKAGESGADYSHAPAFLGVMHAPTGTTTVDFVYNAFVIISIALAILAIVITVFCIFDDIRGNTVTGALVSPHGRGKIIWSKIVACFVAMTAVVAIFCILLFICGAIIAGGASAPPVLLIVFGKYIAVVSPFMCLMLYLAGLLVFLFFIVAFTSLLCLVMQNKWPLLVFASVIAAGLIVGNLFLSPFTIYQIIIWPILAVLMAACLIGTHKKFKRKDF